MTKIITAAYIMIGDEILSGRTKDENLNFLAVNLTDIGINLEEVRVVPDNEEEIINAIKQVKKKYNYIFTTGGIGPTHDDITAVSVSKAFNLKYEVHKEAFKILEAYYKPGEFNEGRQKMVWMPENAELILSLP